MIDASATLDRALAAAIPLHVQLDEPLPAELAAGRGTAVFVYGTCFSPAAPIASLALTVDGAEQPVMAHGMPRLDMLRTTGTPTSYRSGFWGFARLAERRDQRAPWVLGLRARLEGGGEPSVELGRIPVAEPPAPLSDTAPEVAICMATYEPPLDLFRRQVDSIRAQTHGDWLCVVSDDCSPPELRRAR